MSLLGLTRAVPTGWSVSAPSQFSDVYLLGDRERIVHLNTEVPDCAFYLRMAKQKLHRSKVARLAVDQSRLRAAQRVGTEQTRIKAHHGNPDRNKPRILPRGQAPFIAAPAAKEKAPGQPFRQTKILIDRLTGLFGEFETNGTPRFFWRTVARSMV